MNARNTWYVVAPAAIAVIVGAIVIHCIAPFSAIAVFAGIAVARRYAVTIAFATWLINQMYGFGFAHYPHTLYTYIAGVSLALGSVAAVYIAGAISRGKFGLSSLVAFLAGFAVFEAVTFAFTPFVGGAASYAPSFLVEIFAVNAIFFVPLFIVGFFLTRMSSQSDFVRE